MPAVSADVSIRSDVQRDLAALLRCPATGSPVVWDGDEIVATETDRRYPVVDGIPVMVSGELAADPQYDHQRDYFDAEFAAYGAYTLDRWRVSFLRRLGAAGFLAGGSAPLIDVGVGGSGYTVIEAARQGRPAVGCDLSLEGLRAARRFAEDQGVADRTLFVCCSAEALPFASGVFGAALAIAVLEHVPDDVAAMGEMARVLRPGGGAWATAPHSLRHVSPLFWAPNRRHDRRLGHLRRYTAASLAGLGEGAGLIAGPPLYTGHAVKVAQILATGRLPGSLEDRFWWACEARDLALSGRRRGSMQLSMTFHKP